MPERRVRWSLLIVVLTATGCGRDSAQQPEPPSVPRASQAEPRRESVAEAPPTEEPRPAAPIVEVAEQPVAPEERSHILVRRPDTRPQHDDARLAELGIAAYESKRLKLYSDIDPAVARTLPPIIDQAYDEWERYFGPLPPARDGSDYQITGYVMADADLFRSAGLLPEDLPSFQHGRHWDAEFWMNEQQYDYYRRHLLIHEATHCFMTALRSMTDVPPVWYMEGMAEHFGTHTIEHDKLRFRVMPHDRNAFGGLGRITMIRNEVAAGRFRSLDRVLKLRARDFLRDEAYAWSWALCCFLDTHPRYRDRFRQLGDCLTFESFRRTFPELFDDDMADLRTEWALFAHNLQEGYDVPRSSIAFQRGAPLTSGRRSAGIAADRGWQASGVLVEQGVAYRITAGGQFTLAQSPKPWVSEPQGISFRYFGGRPLGELHATVRAAEPQPDDEESMLHAVPIGREATFVAPATGTLYLRLNDSWSELEDNTGAVRVQIQNAVGSLPQ